MRDYLLKGKPLNLSSLAPLCHFKVLVCLVGRDSCQIKASEIANSKNYQSDLLEQQPG